MEEGDLPGSSPRSGQEEELAGPGRIFCPVIWSGGGPATIPRRVARIRGGGV